MSCETFKKGYEDWYNAIKAAGDEMVKISHGTDRIIIYGMGYWGHEFVKIVGDSFNDKNVVIWDVNANNLLPVQLGDRLIYPENPIFESCNNRDAVYFCITNKKILKDIDDVKRKFAENDVSKIYLLSGESVSDLAQYQCLDVETFDPKKCSECPNMPYCNVRLYEYYNKRFDPFSEKTDELNIKRLSHIRKVGLEFSDLCNLNCSGCPYSAPAFRKSKERTARPDVDSCCKTLDTVYTTTEIFDTVIIGRGEPFLWQDEIMKLAEHIFSLRRIHCLQIITNGTIPIKPELLELLSKNKRRVLFIVDDYHLSHSHTAELIKKLQDNEFVVVVLNGEINQWYDLSNVSEHDVDGLIEKKCPWFGKHGFELDDGRLYPRCGLQFQKAVLVGNPAIAKEIRESDSVDVINTPREQLADAIIDIHNNRKVYAACRYCVMSQEEPTKIPCAGRLEVKDTYEKFLKPQRQASK